MRKIYLKVRETSILRKKKKQRAATGEGQGGSGGKESFL